MEIRNGLEFGLNHAILKHHHLDYQEKIDEFNKLMELNEGLMNYDWQLSPFQKAVVEHLVENMNLTEQSFR